jgi:uncharacterized protein YjbI with pentapeptide repeats
MTAEEFRIHLLAGDSGSVRGQSVTGAVDLRGTLIRAPIVLVEVDFEGEANFADTVFEHSLAFVNCSFAQGLSLNQAKVHGRLYFESVQFFGWRLRFMEPALGLEGAEIGGSVELTRTVINAPLKANGVRVRGGFHLIGCECREQVSLAGASVGMNVEFSAWSPSDEPAEHNAAKSAIRTQIFEGLDLTGARVKGSVTFVGARIRELVNFIGAKIEVGVVSRPHSVFVSATQPLSTIFRTEMGDDWNMAAATVGYCQVGGTLIDGAVILNLFTCGSVTFGRNEGDPCRLGGLFGLAMDVGWLSLNGIQITGTAVASPSGHRGIWLEDSTIKGRLVTWQKDSSERQNPRQNAPRPGALIIGDLVAQNCRISGVCDFTNLRVTGGINLSNSDITGSLLFGSEVADQISETESPELWAQASWAEFKNLTCRGDVDLSGLRLKKSFLGDESPRSLSLNATDLVCNGDVILAAKSARQTTIIPGWADFSRAKAGRFVFSGQTFSSGNGGSLEAGADRLILEGTTLGTMEIIGEADSYPAQMNLANLSVNNWLLGESRLPDTKLFKALLERDQIVRRDTYRGVEKYFRDQGHENAANQIIVALGERISHEKRGFFRAIGEFFKRATYGSFLGYGTSPVRLGGVIILVWLLAFPIYCARENFEPALPAQAILVHTDPASLHQSPSLDEWRGLKPFFMSVRYHLPAIDLGSTDDWTLRSEGVVHYPLFHTVTLPVTPESMGSAILLLNWVLWPPFLAFLLRKAFRNA